MTTVKKTKYKVVTTPTYWRKGTRRTAAPLSYSDRSTLNIKEDKWYALYLSGCKAKKLAKLMNERLSRMPYKPWYSYEAVPMGTK